ncbi:MAG: hypothetical protein WB797_08745, partial [Nocardioides sp.]
MTPAPHDLVLRRARLITGERAADPTSPSVDGWVAVDGGRIAGLGEGEAPPAATVVDLGGDWLA